MSEKRIGSELTRYAVIRIPQEKELKDVEKFVEREGSKLPVIKPGKFSLLHKTERGYEIRFPRERLKEQFKRVRKINETWLIAEKEELAPRGLKYDRFVPLTKVTDIAPPRGRPLKEYARKSEEELAVRIIRGNLVLRLPKQGNNVIVPREAIIVSDQNPTGHFFSETAALTLKELGAREVEWGYPEQTLKSFNLSDYSVEARKHIVRTLFDQGYNRVASVIAAVIDRLKLYPKKRAIINKLRGFREDYPQYDKLFADMIKRVREDDMKGAVELAERIDDEKLRKKVKQTLSLPFLFSAGRTSLLTLALLDDLERENVLVLQLPQGEFKLPVSNIAPDDIERVRVRLSIIPQESVSRHYTVSHDEAVRYLVSRGLSTDDAEALLERLWLRGYISYARNAGKGVLASDTENLRKALEQMGLQIDESKLDTTQPGLYPRRSWGDLTGVEREFMDWLGQQIATQKVRSKISAGVYIGKQLVDSREYEDVVAVDRAVDGEFEPIRIEKGEDGVPLERLVELAQQLGIGTEATRASVLRALQDAGLITAGERIKLTHNGRIISALAKAAFPNATDADVMRDIIDELYRSVERGEPVDKVLRRAFRRTFVTPETFAKRAAELLSNVKSGSRAGGGFVDNVISFVYMYHTTAVARGAKRVWPTLRDIARTLINGGHLSDEQRQLLAKSGYFELRRGSRRDSILVVLNDAGLRRAKELLPVEKEGESDEQTKAG